MGTSPEESVRVFKSLSTLAAAGLPKQPQREAWNVWLDELRREGWFQLCSESSYVVSKEGLSEALREGWRPKVKGVVSNGILTEQDTLEFPNGRRPGDEYTNVTFSGVTTETEHVVQRTGQARFLTTPEREPHRIGHRR